MFITSNVLMYHKRESELSNRETEAEGEAAEEEADRGRGRG